MTRSSSLAFLLVPLLVALCLVLWFCTAFINDSRNYEHLLESKPEIINAEVIKDTGDFIILESEDCERIVVGDPKSALKGTIEQSIREEAYLNSVGVEKGDKVTVEKRKDIYSNIRVIDGSKYADEVDKKDAAN